MYTRTTLIQGQNLNIDEFFKLFAKNGGTVQKYDDNFGMVSVTGLISHAG